MATAQLHQAHQRILQPITRRHQTLDWLSSRVLVVPVGARHLPPPPTKRPRENDGGGPAKQPKREQPKSKEFQHNVSGGEFTTNRGGKGLCKTHQLGQCTKPDCKYAHQCTKCLSPEHGSAKCSKVAPSSHKKAGRQAGPAKKRS